MILNATITRIDEPAEASLGGDLAWTEGSEIDVRCCLGPVTREQRYRLGSVIALGTATAFVPWQSEDWIDKGWRIVMGNDGCRQRLYEVVHVTPYVHGGQSHHEVVLKEVGSG